LILAGIDALPADLFAAIGSVQFDHERPASRF
jgi:hypothetical protein